MVRKIMIGCPIRNRAWMLPRYLDSITQLEYPAEYLRYCFIINDCDDSTPEVLADFARKQPGRVRIVEQNMGKYRSSSHLRGYYRFAHLAKLRNILLAAFLASDCDYLLSVDSDILLSLLALKNLLDDDCQIISALVCNGHELGEPGIYNIFKQDSQGRWKAIREFPRDRIFEVDCTGAAYLLKREVVERYEVRYSAVYGAEDIGFCIDARSKGLRIYCDGRVEVKHVMREKQEEV